MFYEEHSALMYKKISLSWNKRNEILSLTRYLKNPMWFLLSELPQDIKLFKQTPIGEHLKNIGVSPDEIPKELKAFYENCQKAIKNKAVEQFFYGTNYHGLCYPLMYEDMVFGIIILYGMRKSVKTKLLSIVVSLIDTVVREVEKEVELEELNETIRPRAIALSTVHTVHRLMGTTLDIGELLPRIARLSLQVIRANRCSIKLLDKKCKTLLPKCTIDLRKKKTKLKKVAIGRYAPGKAVKHSCSIRGDSFLATPLIDENLIGVITLYDKLDAEPFTVFDEEIMKTLAEQSAIAIRNAQLFQEQEDLTKGSIKCISQLLETRAHILNRPEGAISKIITLIGRNFNMNESEIKRLQYAAMLHDAGQIGVPEKVLMKRGELTKEEYEIIKMHPVRGASLLSKIKPLKSIIPIILYHHENYDGSGYPKALRGQSIPLSARILAVVASFEAMITIKSYRKALPLEKAIEEVKKSSGKQFDPKVVKFFEEVVKRADVKKLLKKELKK